MSRQAKREQTWLRGRRIGRIAADRAGRRLEVAKPNLDLKSGGRAPRVWRRRSAQTQSSWHEQCPYALPGASA